jgi:hypothetical protein
MTMTSKTNFRRVDRIQFAQDIKVDKRSEILHDRVVAIRGRVGRLLPEEMGFTKEQWLKLSTANKELNRADFWTGLKIRAMNSAEFQEAVAEAREALGV